MIHIWISTLKASSIRSSFPLENIFVHFLADYLNIFAVYHAMYFPRELLAEIFLQRPADCRDFFDVYSGFDVN
jgi:hypothetical protein